MGGSRKSTTKKLPYKVLGKKLVHAELRSGPPPTKRELTDVDRWHLAQDANPAALRRWEPQEEPRVQPLPRRDVIK